MPRPLALILALAALAQPLVATAAETYHFRLPNPAAQAAASATSKALIGCMGAVHQYKSGPFGMSAGGDTGCQTSEDGGAVYAPVTPPNVPGIGGKFLGMQPPPGITGAFDRNGRPLAGKKPVATKPTLRVVNFPASAKVGDQVTATLTTAGIGGSTVLVHDGALPPGIALGQNNLDGQFTTAGSYAFTLRATKATDPNVFADAKVTVTVLNADGTGGTTPVDPNGGLTASYPKVQSRLGDAIAALPIVANAKGSVTYALKEGSTLPAGFTLDASTGAIGGKGNVVTPAEMTDPAFYVTVSDGKSSFDAKVSYTTWVKVADVQPGRVQDTQDFDLSTSSVLPGNAQTLTFTLAQVTHLKGGIFQTSGAADIGLIGFQVSADGNAWQTLRPDVDMNAVGGTGKFIFILKKSLDVGYVRLTNRSTTDYVLTQADFGVGSDSTDTGQGGSGGGSPYALKVDGWDVNATVGDKVNALVLLTGAASQSVNAIGTVPPGLRVTDTGIVGQYTTAGTYKFTLRGTAGGDASGKYADLELTVLVRPATPWPAITVSNLPAAPVVGDQVAGTISVTGITNPRIVAGAGVPPGLTVTDTCVCGTVTQAGTYSFDLTAHEDNNPSQSVRSTVDIEVLAAKPDPRITSTFFPDKVEVGGDINAYLNAEGMGLSRFTIVDALPPGLKLQDYSVSLKPNMTMVYGTPAKVGQYTFTIRAQNVTDPSLAAQATFTLTVVEKGALSGPTLLAVDIPSSVLVGDSLKGGFGGNAYSPGNLRLTGDLPPGISLDNSSLSGTFTKAGTYTFTVSAVETGAATVKASVSLTITVLPGTRPGVVVPGYPSSARVGDAVNATALAVAIPDASLKVVGDLPPGLAFANGMLSGAFAKAGTYAFDVVATSARDATLTASRTLSVTVSDVPKVSVPSFPTSAKVGDSLNAPVVIAGIPDATVSVVGGLPDGISYADGALVGKFTGAGSYGFTLNAVSGDMNLSGRVSLRVTVADATAKPTVTVSRFNATAMVGDTVVGDIVARNMDHVVFQKIDFPPGMKIAAYGSDRPGEGFLEGTYTQAGTYTFTLRALDALNTSIFADTTLTVTVTQASTFPGIHGSGLNGAPAVGDAVTGTIVASNVDNVTFQSSGLPPGMKLTVSTSDPNEAFLEGTFTQAGTYTYTVRAVNALDSSAFAIATTTVTVTAAAAPSTLDLKDLNRNATVGDAVDVVLAAENGKSTVKLVLGALPPGMALSGTRLRGTYTTPGSYTFTLGLFDNATPGFSRQQVATSVVVVPRTQDPREFFISYNAIGAQIGSNVSLKPYVQGANGAVAYRLKAGSVMAPGLSLDPTTGTVSGTIPVANPWTGSVPRFTVVATSNGKSVESDVVYWYYQKLTLVDDPDSTVLSDNTWTTNIKLASGDGISFLAPQSSSATRLQLDFLEAADIQKLGLYTSVDGKAWRKLVPGADYTSTAFSFSFAFNYKGNVPGNYIRVVNESGAVATVISAELQ